MWSAIGSWALRNWLPILVTGAVVALYLYVSALRSTIDDKQAKIDKLEVQITEVANEAKRQDEAFKGLKKTFEDYSIEVTNYIKAIELVARTDQHNKEVVNTTGTEEDRNASVDPYTREVLEKLCKLNPLHC